MHCKQYSIFFSVMYDIMSFAGSEARDWRRVMENGKRTRVSLGHTEGCKAGLQLGLETMRLVSPVDIQLNVGWGGGRN